MNLKWKNLKPDIESIPFELFLSNFFFGDCLRIIHFADNSLQIFINEFVRLKIINHLQTDKVELGGLLVGRIYSIGDFNEGIKAVEICDSIPSEEFESNRVSLIMGTDVWNKARKNRSEKQYVIGWYHSHPNLGAFFSQTDISTQSKVFNNSFNVGLVIDPQRNEERWFVGKDCKETKYIYNMQGKNLIN